MSTVYSYDPSARYRHRAKQKAVSSVIMAVIVVFSSMTGFWLGKQYGKEKVLTLEGRLKTLGKQQADLQANLTDLRSEAQTANTRYEQLRAQYGATLSEGPVQELIKLVQEQVEQGMSAERIAFLIKAGRPPTDCTESEIKRFVVSTPFYKGSDSTVSIADGAVVIKGKGASALNKQGHAEAWFDPAQPVEITFSANGKDEVKQGNFPIRQNVVVGDREYRFSIEEGSKSFAKIVFDSCAYP